MLLQVSVEPFVLGEKAGIWKIAVDDADGIVFIERNDQLMTSVTNGLQMLRRDEAADAGDRE